MKNQIILQGITFDELIDRLRAVVKEELKSNEQAVEITKAEACRKLNISFPTLKKRMQREKLTKLFTTDLHKLETR